MDFLETDNSSEINVEFEYRLQVFTVTELTWIIYLLHDLKSVPQDNVYSVLYMKVDMRLYIYIYIFDYYLAHIYYLYLSFSGMNFMGCGK